MCIGFKKDHQTLFFFSNIDVYFFFLFKGVDTQTFIIIYHQNMKCVYLKKDIWCYNLLIGS
jgi:hypothetical protein